MDIDYNGFQPDPPLRALPRIHKERSPIHQLVDDVLQQNEAASRAAILDKLIKNPGVVATFNENFVVEMGPMQINDIPTEDRNANEYRIEVVQPWRIRRRTDEDGRPVPLGGDSGGKARED